MGIFDYKCLKCGHVNKDVFGMGNEKAALACASCYEVTEHARVWSAPHIGRGSSGEPPR